MTDYTKVADVIVPEVFNPYVIERTAELSALVQSGIIETSPELDKLASGGGRLISMPYWQDLAGEDELLSDTSNLTPAKIVAKQDQAVLLMRGRAWAATDLAKALSGDDPMGAIANLVADYWARRRQATLLAILHTLGIEGATNDVVTNTRQILDTAAANEHDGVLLQVVAFARDVCGDFHTGAQAHTGDLTQCRVRLLRGGGVNTGAHATTQRASLQCQSLGLLRLCLTSLTDELFNSRQLEFSDSVVSLAFV